jgi:hypothetical protein
MYKIQIINFWDKQDNLKNFWIIKYLQSILNTDFDFVDNNPDILLCSCFGNINNAITNKAKVKIFFYGENLNYNYPYNNFNLLEKIFNVIAGFNYTNFEKNIIRFPLWLLYYPYYKYEEDNNILKYLETSYKENLKITKENASLVCNYDKNGQRILIYDELSKYIKILCPSNFKRNTDRIEGTNEAKINFIKNTIYNICPENSEFEGYFTEKIFQSLEAGCIPIYWAIDLPEKDIINENSYCFVNIKNQNDIKNKIKDVVINKDNYIQNNIFKENAKYVVNDMYKTLEWKIKEKLDLIQKQQIYFINDLNLINSKLEEINDNDILICGNHNLSNDLIEIYIKTVNNNWNCILIFDEHKKINLDDFNINNNYLHIIRKSKFSIDFYKLRIP